MIFVGEHFWNFLLTTSEETGILFSDLYHNYQIWKKEIWIMVKKWSVTIPKLSGDTPRTAYIYLPESYEKDPDRQIGRASCRERV